MKFYSTALRHARYIDKKLAALLAVLIVISLGTAWQISSKTVIAQNTRLVTVYLDNKRQVIASDAETVEDVLKQADFTIKKEDKTEPMRSTELSGAEFTINVYRARPVTVVDGANSRTIITAERSPKKIANEASFTTKDEDQFAFVRSDDPYEIAPGTHMIIKRSKTITLDLYGKSSQVNTHEVTVGEFMKARDLSLEKGDELNVSEATRIQEGMTISIAQVGREVKTVEEEIPFPEEIIQDVNQLKTYQKINEPGKKGKKMVTYEFITKNGQPAGKVAIKEVVTLEPVKQVKTVGAKGWSGSLEQWLLALRTCESGGNYQTNTGNGFYGAYQFMLSTWRNIALKNGRSDLAAIYPHQAAPADQDYMIIRNTQMTSGLTTQNPGCYRSTGISNYPPQ